MNGSGTSRRLFFEGAVIVISILFAFAVDAAWDERTERREEADALAGLAADFEENLVRLRRAETGYVTLRNGLLGMLRLIGERGDPPGSYAVSDSILNRLGGAPTFRPVQGALTSLLNSNGLELIRDDSLRVALAGWPALLDDLSLSDTRFRDLNDRHVVPLLHDYVAYISVDYRRGIEGLLAPSRFDSDFRGLLDSREFENWLDIQLLNVNRSDVLIKEVIAQAEWILRRIELQ